MPELPEVETTRRGLSPLISHQTIKQVVVREARLRQPAVPEQLNLAASQRIQQVNRRAKYLQLQLQSGEIIIHLGMSGHLRVVSQDTPVKKHDHIDIVFTNGQCLRFNDPRRFGLVVWNDLPLAEHVLFQHLGPEPLTDAFDSEYLYQKSRKRRQSIKPFIMDNQTVVGVGNIYAQESLFKAGINPKREAGRISFSRYQVLVREIKHVLEKAINLGGTSLKDFYQTDGKPGYFAQELLVYGRESLPCTHCETPLKAIKLGGRASTYCGTCQR